MNRRITTIIVGYNSEDFLDACLQSVLQSSKRSDHQVVLIDNASRNQTFLSDLTTRYPTVALIRNLENLGFAKACNQGIRAFPSQFYALLNPDCVVLNDALEKCVSYLEEHPEAGIVGCRVENPDGSLQLACRRSMPRPSTALYRFLGLARLFPRSVTFARYNYGHMDAGSEHEVEAVSGAFMVFRAAVLKQIGLLDERFFLYGEDLDFCWRAILQGWKVMYYPEAAILHHKRQSSSREPEAGNFHFYNSMKIFYRIHYGNRAGRFRKALIFAGIDLLHLVAWLRNRLPGPAEVGSRR
jgi:GT2 family glycosyltransferase